MSRLCVVSWNTTKRCNLKCEHCYLDAGTLTGGKDELSTAEGYELIDQIAANNSNAVLILTGGEPLLRDDIYNLAAYARTKGMFPVLGTNGTLLNDDVCKKLLGHGVQGVGVSIDSLRPEYHDSFRGVPGALEKTIKGLQSAKRAGIDLQVQTTVTRFNKDEIEDIIKYSSEIGSRTYNIFFLVCTGRGQKMTDISPAEYEEILKRLAILQKKYQGKMILKAKCAPHIKRVAYQDDPGSSLLKGYATDCLAAVHYCRVDSAGNVTPCPYMPLSAGNVRARGFMEIWESSDLFRSFRDLKLEGKCGRCDFRLVCGGCRARAYASTGSYLKEDPWCVHLPPEGEPRPVAPATEDRYWREEDCLLAWTPEAKERLKRIPFFARHIAVKAIERYAKKNNIRKVTPEIMQKSKGRGHHSWSMEQWGKG